MIDQPGELSAIDALAADPDELFAALVPDAERAELHSFGGTVARGRIIFRHAFLQVRDVVCPIYERTGRGSGDEIQLITLIVGSLVGQVALGGIPLVPLAALMVKIGLGKLCATQAAPADE